MCRIIGEIKDGIVIKGSSGEGFIYKNPVAFRSKEGICYVPELTEAAEIKATSAAENEAYSYKDFLDLVGGNEEVAELVFNGVTWEHPEVFIESSDYLITCRECGWVYEEDASELDMCPKCGSKQYLI
jgi:rubrerythrin